MLYSPFRARCLNKILITLVRKNNINTVHKTKTLRNFVSDFTTFTHSVLIKKKKMTKIYVHLCFDEVKKNNDNVANTEKNKTKNDVSRTRLL